MKLGAAAVRFGNFDPVQDRGDDRKGRPYATRNIEKSTA